MRKRRKKSFHLLFQRQIRAKSKPGAQNSVSPTLGAFFGASPGTLAGSWIGSRLATTGPGAPVRDAGITHGSLSHAAPQCWPLKVFSEVNTEVLYTYISFQNETRVPPLLMCVLWTPVDNIASLI